MDKMTKADPAPSNPAVKVGANDRSQMVVAKVPQGYDTKINIRFVPGRDLQFHPEVLGCRSRQGAPRQDAEPLALPESLVGKLKDANKKVIDWLAQDAANAQLFLARPVEALIKAGVNMTRSEQKALNRTHGAVKEATVIAPGVKVAELSAMAYPTGRVGELKPGPKTKGGRDKGCGPAPKVKE